MNLSVLALVGLASALAQLGAVKLETCEPQIAVRHQQDNARCPGTTTDEIQVLCKLDELELVRKCIEPEFKRLLPCDYLEMKILSYRRQCLKLNPRFVIWMLKVFVYLGDNVTDIIHVQVLQNIRDFELLRMANNNHEDLELPYEIENNIQACPQWNGVS